MASGKLPVKMKARQRGATPRRIAKSWRIGMTVRAGAHAPAPWLVSMARNRMAGAGEWHSTASVERLVAVNALQPDRPSMRVMACIGMLPLRQGLTFCAISRSRQAKSDERPHPSDKRGTFLSEQYVRRFTGHYWLRFGASAIDPAASAAPRAALPSPFPILFP
ncbi:hypothetical protein [Dyella sp. 2RAB6]|uniref:hypothetical protein n=1 Tax=Dyella sp. 2RAB6 TaxID=3232992 RepID=UPI003F8E3C7B